MHVLVGANSRQTEMSQIEIIIDVSFCLTFINIKILSSTTLNNILSSSSPQGFVFLILTFVNFCQNEVLSKERQLMKWIRTFGMGILWGEFDGWEFSRWNFSRTVEKFEHVQTF